MPSFRFEGRKVYYRDRGRGAPVVLIHGNTASGKLFVGIEGPLSKRFRVITPDLPGHGLSERLPRFPDHFWAYHADAMVALCRHLRLGPVRLVGTSGGGTVALNVALTHPELVASIVADSVPGQRLPDELVDGLAVARARDKESLTKRLGWLWMHGLDWTRVVDQDTASVVAFHRADGALLVGDVASIEAPVLLLGSRRDELLPGLEAVYERLASAMPHAQVRLFDEGGHPTLLTRRPMTLDIIIPYLAS